MTDLGKKEMSSSFKNEINLEVLSEIPPFNGTIKNFDIPVSWFSGTVCPRKQLQHLVSYHFVSSITGVSICSWL